MPAERHRAYPKWTPERFEARAQWMAGWKLVAVEQFGGNCLGALATARWLRTR